VAADDRVHLEDLGDAASTGLRVCGETIVRHFLACPERLAAETLPDAVTRIHLRMDDLGDWTVTLVPTGGTASVGQRLRAVRRHVADRSFLANYADGLSDLDLPAFLARFEASGAIAGLVSVRHPGSFHVVSTGRDGRVARVVAIGDSDVRINGVPRLSTRGVRLARPRGRTSPKVSCHAWRRRGRSPARSATGSGRASTRSRTGTPSRGWRWRGGRRGSPGSA
jgi:glucose-1-phosphate cytidylyltransferase